jgi:hypothetical protein
MATLPRANVSVSETAGAVAGGIDTICVWSAAPTNADGVPRLFGSAAAIYAMHGYCPGVEYASLHTARTRKSIMFQALPIATPGVVGREDTSGNTGTSVTSVVAGSSGVLNEHDGVLEVITGGTIGTHQIVLSLSCDGGRSYKRVRLGTANTYTIPYLGARVDFAPGTLVAGDTIHTWHGTSPASDSTAWTAARIALAAQLKSFRSILKADADLLNSTEAGALLTEIEALDTSNDRSRYLRASVYDRLPLATMSQTTHRMTGSPNVTFAEVGATGDTITRAAGSFVTDGFATNDIITITGAVATGGANNITTADKVTVAASVITLDTDDLIDEGPIGTVSIVGEASLTFAAGSDAVTRSSGSWLEDGFRIGDSVVVTGTASNDGTYTVAAVNATVLDLGDGLADEVIGITSCAIVAGQTKAAWAAAVDADFDTNNSRRVNLSMGRGRLYSSFSSWNFRVPANWIASTREYQHDLHISTWRKSDGPTGADLWDADGNLVEYDDYVDGAAATAARFTSLRSYANGQAGAFVARDLTRADDASILSNAHNNAVVCLAEDVVQAITETAAIGESLILNSDGTATTDSLATLETIVNATLQDQLLSNKQGEGPRASQAKWAAATDDVLNIPEPVLNGVLTLNLRGTIHTINTTVKVVSGGQ